ncbi:MAG: ABC transporter permease [Candidatus Micrarchaeota archaeon]
MVAVAELFFLALNNIRQRRVRSLLTIIGIFIGISAVVALISLGEGLQNVVSGEFAKLGADKITVMGYNGIAASPFVSASLSNPITTDELKVVKRTRGVDSAGDLLYLNVNLQYGRESKLTFAGGIPEDDSRRMIEDMQNVEIAQGRKLQVGEGNVVLLGSYAADGLFEKKVYLGDTIKLEGKDYRVVGILKSMGNKIDDSTVIMNLDEMRTLTDKPDLVSMIIAKVKTGEEPDAVAERIQKNLRRYRNVEEGSEDFQVSTSEQLAQSFAVILGIVQAVIVGIAAISLLVGGVGIMNTMYTSVVERTKEIGLMKAVGARNSDVMLVFLFESGLLGMFGGLLGIAFGITLSKIAEILARQAVGSDMLTAAISIQLVGGALLFAFIIGAVSGVLPAQQAASLKPADALRYE